MRYKVEYSWVSRMTGVKHHGEMGTFSTEKEANIMVDTVGAMLDTIADHWGAYVQVVA